jgi:flagellar motility protein MotE (MotC chaperone)
MRLLIPGRMTPRLLPVTIVLLAVTLVAKSVAGVRAAVPAAPAAAAPTPPAPSGPPAPPMSEAEKAVLTDLRERRRQLDAREAALAERENLLAAAEKKLAARVQELTALQARLEALDKTRQSRDEAAWTRLVKLYEGMKPRDAAVIFNDLDAKVLLGVMERMDERRAAPILAAMQPDRARTLTARLAEKRSDATASNPATKSN